MNWEEEAHDNWVVYPKSIPPSNSNPHLSEILNMPLLVRVCM